MKTLRKVGRLLKILPGLIRAMWKISGTRMKLAILTPDEPAGSGEPCRQRPVEMLHHFQGWQKGYAAGTRDALAASRRANMN